MIAADSIKTVQVIQPQAIKDDADFVGGKDATPVSVDTAGWDYARVVYAIGSIDATIANMNVYDSDDDSTYTEIAGLDFVNDASAAPGASDDNTLYACFIDLRDKKRYLQLDLTAGNGAAGTFAVAHVDLFRASTHPNSASERGFGEELRA